jgi:hypothetical protein
MHISKEFMDNVPVKLKINGVLGFIAHALA